jgi:hypothetical protein
MESEGDILANQVHPTDTVPGCKSGPGEAFRQHSKLKNRISIWEIL